MSWAAAGIVFAAALVVRVIYLWQVESVLFFHHPAGDAASYLGWAERIGQGDFGGGEAFYQAPLPPRCPGWGPQYPTRSFRTACLSTQSAVGSGFVAWAGNFAGVRKTRAARDVSHLYRILVCRVGTVREG